MNTSTNQSAARAGNIHWQRIKSLRAFEKYQKQFDGQSGFTCHLTYGFMPSGDWGRIETYSQNEVPIFQIKTANNHAFSGVYIPLQSTTR